MGTFQEMPSFKRLLVWIDGNGGEGYGCIELNTAAEKRTFIEELKMSLPEPLAEVDFSPEAGKYGYEDADLIVPGRIYETIRKFEEKYPEKPILVMNGLERTVPRDDEQVRKLASVINMNRDNFYRYPAVVLFIFPNWFMDVMFREAFDFTSAMGFHEDMTDGVDAASGGEGEFYSFSDETGSDIPVRPLYDSYAERMHDARLPAAERLEAAAKLVGVIDQHYLRKDTDKALIKEAESLLELSVEGESPDDADMTALWKADLLYSLGLYFRNQGDPALLEEALRYSEEALAISLKILGESHPFVENLYLGIGLIYHRLGREEEALGCYEKALKTADKYGDAENGIQAAAYNNLGIVYLEQGDREKALAFSEKALAEYEKLRGKNHPSAALVRSNVGAVLSSMGDDERAMEYYEEALRTALETAGEDDSITGNIYYKISHSEERLGEPDKALLNCRKAFEILKKVQGPEHPDTKLVQRKLERLEREMKAGS